MKTLEQIQEENRKAIIMANYPDCDKIVGNKIKLFHQHEADEADQIEYKTIKCIDLAMVLIALGHNWELQVKQDSSPDKSIYFYIFDSKNLLCWEATKPTLEEQDEQTQREINKLLTQ